ncbi:exopolysaccharide biosynthesis protein [Methanobacterium alcaliphilum]|uniref:exopolysaccharide biosynthesis protein n=1 Tax=Methanobacterium alcaliphilum TaxID=392018 RepID=UPI00200B7968|nr:exopolysaccharide biosynthesis protein [Methanobacterium alcaliphilum]
MREQTSCGRSFSWRISQIASHTPKEGMSLEQFLDTIGEEGQLFSCIILTAPFLLPMSIPGSSIPFGLAIFLISLSIISNKRILLPKRALTYKISKENINNVLNGIVRVLKRIEKYIKPRFVFLSFGKKMDVFNAILMAFCSLLLTLPLPIPLTDFLPAYGILFLALGSLECDGYLILTGYGLVTVTTAYFSLTALLGMDLIRNVFLFLGL